jgi:hypothetical protein
MVDSCEVFTNKQQQYLWKNCVQSVAVVNVPDTETVEQVLRSYRDRHRFDTEYRKATGMPAPEEDMPDPVEMVQYLRDAVPDDVMGAV